jgi:FkbM family methyltransferase
MAKPVVRIVGPMARRAVRHLGATVRVDPELLSLCTRAELFWGLYERAECAYIDRDLARSATVVDLGAGIGVSSAHIAAGLRPDGALTCAEANAAWLPAIRRNVEPYIARSGSSMTRVHATISACEGRSILNISANPFASMVKQVADPSAVRAVSVRARSLESIAEEHRLECFDLVCDLGGAEANLITGGELGRCRRLVIELHDCTVDGGALSADELLGMLAQRCGLRVLARKGRIVACVEADAEAADDTPLTVAGVDLVRRAI